MSDARGRRRPARAVFFGSGGFGVPILAALASAPAVEIVGVVSVPAREAGRRHEMTQVPVAARAHSLGLPVMQPASLRTPDALALIDRLDVDVGVLADFGRIVPAAMLGAIPGGVLNVHPSLLPRHRGAAPIAGAILAGDETTGVTVIQMDAGIDTGPIVGAESWPLRGDETAPQLEDIAARRGAALLERLIGPWLAGDIDGVQQYESQATVTRPFTREDGRLDPGASAIDLERRVRALQPWPGTWLDTDGGRLAVWRAEAVGGPKAAAADIGVMDRTGVRTADGYLALHEVQPAGKRRMSYDAFLRGRPAIVGSRIIAPSEHT